MARPPRIEFDGALYHVTASSDVEDIFASDLDRKAFLEILEQVVDRFNWLVHAYCLMGNHYHMLIETPDGNLSPGMRQLNGVYTQTRNRNNNRVGPVFQARYKAILIQKESYLLELSRYVVLNPVRAGMVKNAKAWRWSSFLDTAGYREPPRWLTTNGILATFGKRQSSAQQKYEVFVASGKSMPSPWTQLKNQVYLGSEDFVSTMKGKIKANRDLGEVTKLRRRKKAKSLDYYARHNKNRNQAILVSYASGGYSMKEIGDYFGLHYSWVSRVISGGDNASNKT